MGEGTVFIKNQFGFLHKFSEEERVSGIVIFDKGKITIETNKGIYSVVDNGDETASIKILAENEKGADGASKS
jgi:hypothetical protein